MTVTNSGDSMSGRTSSTSRSTRIQLQLMRLEEEKKAQEKLILEQQEQERLRQEKALAAKAALDKKYLDEKYALLISQAEDEEAGSHRSRRNRASHQSRNSHVQEWVDGVDEAAGGNLVPENVEDIFPPISVGDGLNLPYRGMVARYTGTKPKQASNHTHDAGQNLLPNHAIDWVAENVGAEGTSSIAAMKEPVTASTPIRSGSAVRQPTGQSSLQTQSLFLCVYPPSCSRSP